MESSQQLPKLMYKDTLLAAAASLIRRTPPDRAPALEMMEGLPCRTGLLDAPFAYLLSLVPPHASADLPCAQHALESPLARATTSALSGPPENLLDLSPVGVKLATQILDRVVTVGIGAGVMAEKSTVARLLSFLSQSHLSALLIWPINSGGNRKGVTELVDLVCKTLNSVFWASEASPQDNTRKRAEQELVVHPFHVMTCTLSVFQRALTRFVLSCRRFWNNTMCHSCSSL